MTIKQARAIRRALELTQFSVAVGTGINLGRISKAESGKLQLEPSEMSALESFLRDMEQIKEIPEGQVYDPYVKYGDRNGLVVGIFSAGAGKGIPPWDWNPSGEETISI